MRRPLFRALWLLLTQRSLWLPLAVLPGLQPPPYDSRTTGKADGVPPSGLDSMRRPLFRVSWLLLTQRSLWLPLAVLPGPQPPPKPAPHSRQELEPNISGPVSSHLQRRPFTGLSTSFQVPRCWSQLSFDRAQQQDMRSAAHKRRQVPARHLAANPGAQNSHPASLFLGMLQWVGRAGCQCSCKGLCCFLGAVHQSRLAMASFPLVTHK